MITLAVQCMHFERRLCWLLSSMVEQTCRDFVVRIDYVYGHGSPPCLKIAHYFREKGVAVDDVAYIGDQYDRFQQRGYVRNDQLWGCNTPWIWFADCDHVYHPEYVERLLAELKHHEDETRLLTAGRISTYWGVDPFPFPDAEPVYHRDAFKHAQAVLDTHLGGAVGAGHTQIVKVANLPDRVYVPEGKSNDHKWSERGTKAASDIQFRKKVGGRVKLPRWFTYNQIHLNHRRDAKEGGGRHLTEQR